MLIYILPAIAILLMSYTVVSAISNEPVISRLKKYTDKTEIAKAESIKKNDNYKSGLGFLARGIEKSGMFYKYKNEIRVKLVKANLMLKPEEMISVTIVCFITCFFIGLLLSGNVVYAVLMSIGGMNIPNFIISKRIKKRIKTINLQLGDTISILSNTLKAGHSFFQAIDSVSKEMTGPISEEFQKLQKEIALGGNTESALENMVKRLESDDVELMVTAVLIQRQIGGNLAEVLDNISNTIRQRVKIKGEIKTLTAQGRMSGWVIALLPFALAIFMAIVSPDQIKLLITDPIGIIMVFIAIVMELIGIFIVRKIVNIKV